MKKLLVSILLTLLMLALLAVFVHAQDSNAMQVDLLAGQDIVAGSLYVWNDEWNLYVMYALLDNWRMTDSHLQVEIWMGDITAQVDAADYVNKKGIPIPGQFDYQWDHDPRVTEYTYMIPLTEVIPGWDPENISSYNEDLFIAAHCSLGDEQTTGSAENPDFVSIETNGQVFTGTFAVLQGTRLTGGELTIDCINSEGQPVGYTADINGVKSVEYDPGDPTSTHVLMEGEVFSENQVIVTPNAEVDLCSIEAQISYFESEETAWAGDSPFGGKRWANYLIYSLRRDVQWPDGGTTTIAFEDFPIGSEGDYDYNDWVVDISTTATFAGSTNDLLEIAFVITPEARGAAFWHVSHLGMPGGIFGSDGQYTLTFFDADGNEIPGDSGAFVASTGKDFVLFHQTASVQDAFEGPVTEYPNTIEPEGIVSHYIDPDTGEPAHRDYIPTKRTARLSIVFGAPVPFDLAAYDPYSPGNMHGQGLFFDPWLWVDPWWLSIGPYQVHALDDRLLAVPADWMWPEAGVHIWMAYPKVEEGDPPVFVNTWWCNPDWIFNSSPYLDSLVYNGPFPEPTFPTGP